MSQDQYTRREFFELVLAEDGYINIRGILHGTKIIEQKYFTDFDEADEFIEHLQEKQYEAYFNCATFADQAEPRDVSNVYRLKSFYMDIDCGASDRKQYKTRSEILAAFKQFLTDTGLPMPSLIDSGNGVHFYWILTEAISYDVWKPIGVGLKAKAAELGLHADPAVTGEGARILRVPYTGNFKDKDNIKRVTIKHLAPPITLAEFTACIPAATTNRDRIREANSSTDELTRSLAGEGNYPPSMFSRILNRSMNTVQHKMPLKTVVKDASGVEYTHIKNKTVEACEGCPQIRYAYENRATLDNQLWCAALSVAQHCEDREWAIPHISEGYPDYDPEYAMETASRFRGPRTCEVYALDNPSLCAGCIHKGQITSPVQLGVFIEIASPQDNHIGKVWHTKLREHVDIEIPITYPWPYVRPKVGGVAYVGGAPSTKDKEPPDPDDPSNDVPESMVYDLDIWGVRLLRDPDTGFSLQVNHHIPKVGLLEFMIPVKDINTKEGEAILGHYGFTKVGTQMKHMQKYLMAWADMLKKNEHTDEARANFGWHDQDRCFAIGNREIDINGAIAFKPTSAATHNTAAHYITSGTLETWSSIANLYAMPGNECRAFTVLAAMGAVLYKFTEMGSSIIHLTNAASGTGKTTLLRMCGSIYGHPKKTLMNHNDKYLYRQHRSGILRHLPTLIDEITNMPPDEMSAFALDWSHNQGRNRMTAQANIERRNDAEWQTLAITSGNNSMHDVLGGHKSSTEGEQYRIIELVIAREDDMDKADSDHWFDQLLQDNYGIAGEIFLQHVVPNLDAVIARLKEVQEEFDKLAGFKQKERHYSAACAVAFTAGEIAVRLGLVSYDLDRIKAWAVATIGGIVQTVKVSSSEDSVSILGRFLNVNINKRLDLQDASISMINGQPMRLEPTKVPSNELVIRTMPDKDRMYIAAGALRAWCSAERINYSGLLNDLTAKHIVTSKTVKIALGKGWVAGATAVPAIEIDITAASSAGFTI